MTRYTQNSMYNVSNYVTVKDCIVITRSSRIVRSMPPPLQSRSTYAGFEQPVTFDSNDHADHIVEAG
jgi:hypothetical protein